MAFSFATDNNLTQLQKSGEAGKLLPTPAPACSYRQKKPGEWVSADGSVRLMGNDKPNGFIPAENDEEKGAILTCGKTEFQSIPPEARGLAASGEICT